METGKTGQLNFNKINKLLFVLFLLFISITYSSGQLCYKEQICVYQGTNGLVGGSHEENGRKLL